MSNVTAHNTWCLEIYCHCSLVPYKAFVLQLITSVLSNTGTHSYATHHPHHNNNNLHHPTICWYCAPKLPLLTHLQIFYFRNKHVFCQQQLQIYSSLEMFLAFPYLRKITDISLQYTMFSRTCVCYIAG